MTLEQLEGIVRRPMRTIAADGREEEKEEATVSVFVDDWPVEFDGPDAPNTSLKKSRLEIASCQRMNKEKTVLGPARKLTEKEERACGTEWKKIKKYHTRSVF